MIKGKGKGFIGKGNRKDKWIDKWSGVEKWGNEKKKKYEMKWSN